MKLSRKLAYQGLCISQAVMLLSLNCSAVLAAGGSLTPAEIGKLDQFERTVFGEAHAKLSPEARLKDLENDLFAKADTGAAPSARLAAIDKALGLGKGANLLMPAMAPQMDTSNATPAAAAAPQSSYTAADAAPEPADRSKELLKEALTLYSSGKTDQAEQAFKRVLSVNNRCGDAYFNLGVIAEGKGDLQGALNDYEAAYRINPSDSELRDTVNSVQLKISQKIVADQKAREQQNVAAQAARQNQLRESLKPVVADASAAYKSGNFAKAVSDLQTVAKQAPQDPDVQYALAQAYRGKGDLTSAKAALDRAISIDPNNQSYRTAMNQVNDQIAQGIGNDASMPRSAPSIKGGGSQYGNTAYGGGSPDRISPPDRITPFDNSGSGRGYSRDASSSMGQTVGYSQDDSGSSGVTPFSSSGDPGASTGFQRAYAASNYNGGGYGGYGSGGSYYRSGSSRLKRAAISGLAGAAMGAMMSGGYGYGGGGSRMRGALMGGALGLITGGLFSN